MEETSLDRFVGDEEGKAEGADSDERTTPESDADEPSGDSADGAGDQSEDRAEYGGEGPTPTLSYAPDGAPCVTCGRAVRRRWHTDAGVQCGDCRAW